MGAYNELYLEDITDLQEALFEEVTQYKYPIDFDNFVKEYMNSKYRHLLDKGNARVANMTQDEFLCYLERDCSNLFLEGEPSIDRLQAGWIGRIYGLLQYYLNESSDEIYQKLPLSKMKNLFIPLHTVDESVAVDKIISTL